MFKHSNTMTFISTTKKEEINQLEQLDELLKESSEFSNSVKDSSKLEKDKNIGARMSS